MLFMRRSWLCTLDDIQWHIVTISFIYGLIAKLIKMKFFIFSSLTFLLDLPYISFYAKGLARLWYFHCILWAMYRGQWYKYCDHDEFANKCWKFGTNHDYKTCVYIDCYRRWHECTLLLSFIQFLTAVYLGWWFCKLL